MGDVLPILSVPAVLLAGGAYAVGSTWWRRHHPAPPSPYTRQALRIAEERTLVSAREILEDAYAAFGPLYTAPAAPAGGPDPQVPASRAPAPRA
ncbi:hypothetical protein [Streptomyces sp. AM 2-1-1]|uniref:hypothetical protein n=1 Tax=unclassified Streptomyces TaxID=2593676 RepID=UPI0023B8ABF0|nr:hypothetical protein [Streptomyces sp. AM 2-1-1]WEH40350.1 hypothetical protein PZB77_12975 [Streptomyces sp. AM 2-1-1]